MASRTINIAPDPSLGTVASLASDIDGSLAANSDTRVPTQKAVRTAIDAATDWDLILKGQVFG